MANFSSAKLQLLLYQPNSSPALFSDLSNDISLPLKNNLLFFFLLEFTFMSRA